MARIANPGELLAPPLTRRTAGLYPAWVGFALAGGSLICHGLGLVIPHLAKPAGYAGDMFYFLGIVYYFVMVYGIARLLREQPGWWQEYSPWGVVWRQMLPLHGLYALSRWLLAIETYVCWRAGKMIRFGWLVFVLLLVGFLCQENPIIEFVGEVLMFGSLLLVYQRLELALQVSEPGPLMPEVTYWRR